MNRRDAFRAAAAFALGAPIAAEAVVKAKPKYFLGADVAAGDGQISVITAFAVYPDGTCQIESETLQLPMTAVTNTDGWFFGLAETVA